MTDPPTSLQYGQGVEYKLDKAVYIGAVYMAVYMGVYMGAV